MQTQDVSITYHFYFPGKEIRFLLKFDSESFELLGDEHAEPPDWTQLAVHQCPHCPFTADERPHCPLASAITGVVDAFKDIPSFTPVDVEVVTAERSITASTTTQRGVSSLMGIIGPASGCPHTAYFRPMARFHLPFATEQETVYRAASMFLLAHFFRSETSDDWLEHAKRIYANMGILNHAFAERLRSASGKDASINALVILDLFAKMMPFIFDDRLEELMKIFGPYLVDAKQSTTH